MKATARFEFRCKEHESRVDGCSSCDYLVRAEKQLDNLREAYSRAIQQICKRVGADLIVVNVR